MTAADTRPTVVTVVHAPACHFCEDAQQGIAEVARDLPLVVELVEAADPGGQALLAEHRAAMLPLVLVDGAWFSVGRLPRGKLRKLLGSRPTAVA